MQKKKKEKGKDNTFLHANHLFCYISRNILPSLDQI